MLGPLYVPIGDDDILKVRVLKTQFGAGSAHGPTADDQSSEIRHLYLADSRADLPRWGTRPRCFGEPMLGILKYSG